MTLGQRLRQARQEAGLSQRQLCGDIITRNMLSLIESDSAKPSMATLQYLAAQLGKPVSWFLEEQPVLPAYTQQLEQARQAYGEQDYARVLQLLEDVSSWEADLLLALSASALSRQAIGEGRNAYGLSLLQKAEAAAERTPYATDALKTSLLLLRYEARPESAGELVRLLQDSSTLLLRAEAALQGGEPEKAMQLLLLCRQQDDRWHLLAGQAAMAMGDFAGAVTYLRGAEAAYPRQTVPALEQCYRELEDYKMAYIYACKQKQ